MISWGKLFKRFDPFYYQLFYFNYFKKLLNSKRKLLKIKEIAKVICGPFGSSILFDDYRISGAPLIRINNIDENGELIFENVTYIDIEKAHLLKSYKVFINDIVISQRGTLGLTALVNNYFNEGVISANFIALKKIKNIDPKFLNLVLNTNIGKIQIKRFTSGQVQTKITTDDVKNILVPFIPKDEAEKVIFLFEKAMNSKKKLMLHYQKLIDSINDYLLSELSITPPKDNRSQLKERVFLRNNKYLNENRYDAFYHHEYFEKCILSTKNSKYETKILKNLIQGQAIKGILPKEEEKDGNFKVVQINCISSDGNINLEDILTSKDIFKGEHKLKISDILVVITGATIGKIAYWDYPGDYYLGGDIIKFQVKGNVDPYYIYAYLRSQLPQIDLKRNITGATNGHLSPYDVKNLLIPLPPFKKQQQIAAHIRQIQSEANRILEQANKELEEAKWKVEEIILSP